jgi:hypothetical protein
MTGNILRSSFVLSIGPSRQNYYDRPEKNKSGKKLEVFFEDTQNEVSGRKFEGTATNYTVALCYSW